LMDEDTVGSSFLFPVSLINELGYFRPSLRFWTSESFADAMEVATRIEHRIKAMGLTDTESAKVLRRFDEARLERRIRRIGIALVILGVIWVPWWIVRRRRTRRSS